MSILHIDIETGGLNPYEHAITSIACIYGEKEFYIEVDPSTYVYNKVSKEALKVQGKTLEELKRVGIDAEEAFYSLYYFLEENGIEELTRVQPVGYKIGFDLGFLEVFFMEHGYDLYDYVSHRSIDILNTIRQLESWGCFKLPHHNLKIVCDFFKIPLEAHNSLNDIRATKELERVLREKYIRV